MRIYPFLHHRLQHKVKDKEEDDEERDKDKMRIIEETKERYDAKDKPMKEHDIKQEIQRKV